MGQDTINSLRKEIREVHGRLASALAFLEEINEATTDDDDIVKMAKAFARANKRMKTLY